MTTGSSNTSFSHHYDKKSDSHNHPPPRQESVRVYLQRYPNSSTHTSSRKLITSSIAIRLTDNTTVEDVTRLMRQKFQLDAITEPNMRDFLVVVGTLHGLPSGYVRYEMQDRFKRKSSVAPTATNGTESDGSLMRSNSDTSGNSGRKGNSPNQAAPSDSEALSVVRTLRPHDKPLMARDQMLHHLMVRKSQISHGSVTHTVRWFFQPGIATRESYNGRGPNKSLQSKSKAAPQPPPKVAFPCYVDLDGYITSPSDSSDDDDDEEDPLPSTPLKQSLGMTSSSLSENISFHPSLLKENYRRSTLDQILLSNFNASITGYLLKRSPSDPNVWRRVYCILTHDQLWYVSRTKPPSKHRCVPLARALIIEPPPGTPLAKIPHAIEMRSSRGRVYQFRAGSRKTQLRWIQAIAGRIVMCYENHFMEMAELLIEDEEDAKVRRMERGCMLEWPDRVGGGDEGGENI